MKRKKLITGLSAAVVAMMVIVLCLAVFSERPRVVPAKETPATEGTSEESPGSEFVKINWQSEQRKGGGKQSNPQSEKTVLQPKDEGETD